MFDDAATALQREMNNPQETPAICDFRFWSEPVMNLETGEVEEVDFVSWRKRDDRNGARTGDKVSRLMGNPARKRAPALVWAIIEPHYMAHKEGQQLVADGTAFEDWRGFDQRLAETLKNQKIYTLEDFAAYPEAHLNTISHPHVRRWHEMTREFLAKRADSAELQAELSKRDAEIAELREMLEKVTQPDTAPDSETAAEPEFKRYEGYDELVLEKDEPKAKRKPGRPRKTETETVTEAA